MADVGLGNVRIIADSDGDTVTVTNNKLDVNATLSTASVNIGDVDVLSVPAPLSVTGGGTESSALRVTLANDSTGTLTVDGTVTANLSATDNAVLDTIDAVLDTIKIDTEAIETAIESMERTTERLGVATYSEGASYGTLIGVVRNDTLATLADTDNEIAPLQVNASGALYTDVASTVQPAGSGTFTSYAQFDAAESPTALTDASNGINATETAAKEVIIQADNDNSGYIMVGGSNAAADTNGIRLNAGDTLILPVANIANIYIDGSAASQKVNVSIVK